MHEDTRYATYIMASISRTLYVGVTSNLRRRVLEHKTHRKPGFTAKYDCNHLVWFQNFQYIGNAIAFEKKLKGQLRCKKLTLIESTNPTWLDLSAEWYTLEQLQKFGTAQTLSAHPNPL